MLRGVGDSLHILDIILQRLTVLSPSGKYVRSNPWPVRTVPSATVVDDGRYVVNAVFTDRARIGFPLHFISPTGAFLNSFRFEEAMVLPRGTWERVLSRGAGKDIWSVTRSYQYRIEHWDSAGQLQQVLVPSRAWFRPYEKIEDFSPHHPPVPQVTAAWYDNTKGYLWVTAMIPDPDWAKGLSDRRRNTDGVMGYHLRDATKVFDGVVEVYDVAQRQLIASGRLDSPVFLSLGDGLFARLMVAPGGEHLVRIDRFELIH
jgi:hypothetical protein